MIRRLFRRSTFVLRKRRDLGRAAWRVLAFWKVPRIEIAIEGLPLLETQRFQLRLRHLNEVHDRRSGGLVAIAVLIIGLADMVRTWNRDLNHMGRLLGLALVAGLAARILSRIWIRLRVLWTLWRLARRIRRWERQGAVQPVAADTRGGASAVSLSPPQAAPAPAITEPPTSVARPAMGETAPALLQGRCACGAVTFALSLSRRHPLLMGTCHCATCRKSGAGVLVRVLRDAVELTSGAADVATWTSPTDAHPHSRSFCSRCGSALGDLTAADHELSLPAHLFDTLPGVRNGFHQFIGEKPDWLLVCDGAMQFPGQRPA